MPPGSARRRRVRKSGPGVGRSHTQAHRYPRRHSPLQQGVALLRRVLLRGGHTSWWAGHDSGEGPAQGPGCQGPPLGFCPARAVGHGQPGGNRQHQPVAAHERGVQAARPVPTHGPPGPVINERTGTRGAWPSG